MTKYAPLAEHLTASGLDRLRMSFAEIEKLVGFSLPKSKVYPAWWSNNPANNVMTKAWLSAGYKTEQVDVPGEKVTFVKVATTPRPETPRPSAKKPRTPLFGGMKGTTFVPTGIDLTLPADPEWGRVYDDEPSTASEEAEDIRANPSLNVSQKIRALSAIGMKRAEIARLLGKRYQHVRNVLVDAERRAHG